MYHPNFESFKKNVMFRYKPELKPVDFDLFNVMFKKQYGETIFDLKINNLNLLILVC